MRARNKQRVSAMRLMTAEFKRIEVDERIDLDDERVLAILDKMLKQRKDSLGQYTEAGRTDLADQEQFEIDLINEYLPEGLDEATISQLIDDAIATTGAESMRDMGAVMGVLRPQVQGRADMGQVSALVKSKLG